MVSPADSRSNFCIRKWIFATLMIVFLLTFCYANENDQEDEFCAMEAALNLTNVSEDAFGFFNKSGYSFPREATRLRAGVRHGCICDIKPCLAYCPKPNTLTAGSTYVTDGLVNYSAIPPVYTTDLTLDNDEEITASEKWFHIVKWDPCPKGAYLLDTKKYPEEKFYLLRNGSLFIPEEKQLEERFKDFKTSCLRLEGSDSTVTPKICGSIVKDSSGYAIYIGGLVSVPFLIATVIVYSILPELNNIHGTTLRCYLCCMILTYVALAASIITRPYDSIVARCFGFTSHFSFVSSFFWLNVMCFDIWWKLGGFGYLQNRRTNHDRKKFIYYSIYAWGIGVILTAIYIGTELCPSIPGSISFISSKVFQYWGPVGLTIVCNVCFFISTIVKIYQHNKKMGHQLSNENSKCHDDHQHWFIVDLNLFVVMGITWSTEIISDIWQTPKDIWYATDTLNALQGILIFVLFICKKNIWLLLRKRFRNAEFCSSNHQLRDSSTPQRNSSSATRSTAYSDIQKSPSSDSNDIPMLTETEKLYQASSSK